MNPGCASEFGGGRPRGRARGPALRVNFCAFLRGNKLSVIRRTAAAIGSNVLCNYKGFWLVNRHQFQVRAVPECRARAHTPATAAGVGLFSGCFSNPPQQMSGLCCTRPAYATMPKPGLSSGAIVDRCPRRGLRDTAPNKTTVGREALHPLCECCGAKPTSCCSTASVV